MYCVVIDVQPIRMSPDELPALAFGSHYSVFKERPGTHQSSRCWCRVCRRTIPDEFLRRRVSFDCQRASKRPFRRENHDSRRASERQRVLRHREPSGRVARTAALATDRSGTSAVTDGCPLERSGSLRSRSPDTPVGGMRRLAGRPHATGASKLNGLSASHLSPKVRRFEGRAPPADAIDLPHVTTMRWLHHALPLLHGRDRAVTPRGTASPLVSESAAPRRARDGAGGGALRPSRPRDCRAPRTASASPSRP